MLRPAIPLILLALLAPALASAAEFVAKPSLATEQDPATLVLDASRAADGIMEVRERIPASAGSFTVVYPKWIPGEHGPTGPSTISPPCASPPAERYSTGVAIRTTSTPFTSTFQPAPVRSTQTFTC